MKASRSPELKRWFSSGAERPIRGEKMTTMTYSEVGDRSRQDIYWTAGVMLLSAIVTVGLYALRTGEIVRPLEGGVWIVLVAWSTIWTLKRLTALEQTHSHPTEAMQLVFRLALTQPILGTIPLMIGFR
jgi:hypothetical protein